MSTLWKWILGIVAVLVILGVVAAAVFVWWNHAPLTMSARAERWQEIPPAASGTPTAPKDQVRPRTPYGIRPEDGFHNFGRMPMMGGRGYRSFGGWMPFGMGFFFLGGFFHWIVPLGILILVAILFYELGKRAGMAKASAAPPAPPAPPRPGRRVARR